MWDVSLDDLCGTIFGFEPSAEPSRMEFRDRSVWLEEGEFLIVPRGVEHRPVAEKEVHVLLFEPAGTLNTGDMKDERMVEHPQQI